MNETPHNIAVLDDDPSVLKAMTRLLRSVGWMVSAFEDPFAFLEHAALNFPSVAVIDVCMPRMNGLEVQTGLQKHSPSTEVIFLTSRDDLKIRETALAEGAFAFLLKPTDEGELLSVIGSAANRKG